MKIGFIGCGNMGGALAKRFSNAGHSVMVSARDKAHAEQCAAACGKAACAGSPSEAAGYANVLVLAVPYSEKESAIKNAGNLDGKIVIDVTNPLKPDFSLAIGFSNSAAEEVAKLAPKAKVVKVFNTVFYQVVENTEFPEKPTVFIVSDHEDAKAAAIKLASEIGFEPVDAGPLSNARLLEPLAMLNIYLGYQAKMGTDIAFRLMKR